MAIEKRKEKSMDKEFMKSFFERYYENPYAEAVKDLGTYHETQKKRQKIEGVFEVKLKDAGEKVWQLFEQYMDAWTDEQEVLLKAMYLLGAEDREKMLRGII